MLSFCFSLPSLWALVCVVVCSYQCVTVNPSVSKSVFDRRTSCSLVDAAPVLCPANGHYYELVSTGATFDNALLAAAQLTYNGLAGHLATVTTQDEFDFLVSTFAPYHIWIGGNDYQVEGVFRWVAGPEAGQLVNMTNGFWAPNQPDNHQNNEDCMDFWDHSRLNDHACSHVFAYFVEYEGLGMYLSMFSFCGLCIEPASI